jgi:hypothetical protein
MTLTNNFFAGRLFAAVFALLLSATMVVGSVGPAFNAQPASVSAQGLVA